MAAITSGEVLFKYSVKTGTAGNSTAGTAAGSLGKYISTTAWAGGALNDLFDDVSGAENASAIGATAAQAAEIATETNCPGWDVGLLVAHHRRHRPRVGQHPVRPDARHLDPSHRRERGRAVQRRRDDRGVGRHGQPVMGRVLLKGVESGHATGRAVGVDRSATAVQ